MCMTGQNHFMQDDAPPHIAKPVMQILNRYFRNDLLAIIFQQPDLQDHQTQSQECVGKAGWVIPFTDILAVKQYLQEGLNQKD